MLTKQQALQRLKADIQLRGLSKHTHESYMIRVRKFLEFCNRPIEELDEMDVRQYLVSLIAGNRLSPITVNSYSAAIRFFFAVTLNRTMNYLQIPRYKAPKELPEILTRDEVAQLITASSYNIKHEAFILLGYGSGLRVSEVASLKAEDIDSESMRVLVRGGKGKKDRYTILSERTLIVLRNYWRKYRPKSPEGYLFPGVKNIGHITNSGISFAFNTILRKTNIKKKRISFHSLRHGFATHLLEDGHSILQIKEMLGHSSLSSTSIYLRLANTTANVTSPADKISEKFEDCAI